MKRIDKLLIQLKQVKKDELRYNAACTLAMGISDGSIQWGDDRFIELISGDILRIVGVEDNESGRKKEVEKT